MEQEIKTRCFRRESIIARERQAARMRAYQEAVDGQAMARQQYETAKMEATVKAFVEGSRNKVDVKKFMTEEARLNAIQEKAERDRVRAQRERRICLVAVGMAAFTVLLAFFFIVSHR